MTRWRISGFALVAVIYATVAHAQTHFDATLLAPIDSQITFYAAQDGYYALIGIARDSSVHLLWHNAENHGYVYVSDRDSGYVRIYFLASPKLLDLAPLEHLPSTFTLDEAIASASIVEGYDRKPDHDRQFFTLADPNKRDALTLYKERGARFAEAYEALHPPAQIRQDNGLPGETYLWCLYENASDQYHWRCQGVQ